LKGQEFLAAVRQLLADRFKLVVHREMRELPIYNLVMDRADGRPGPRLKRSDIDCTDPRERTAKNPDGTPTCGLRGRAGTASGRQTIPVLAGLLTNIVADHRPVNDRTGLQGTYEVQLDWTPEATGSADSASGPSDANAAVSIFTTVREQLGLRLEPGKQSLDVLVVDRAERPTEN
jgi:uncharacterized protein (TIGR03435 family)